VSRSSAASAGALFSPPARGKERQDAQIRTPPSPALPLIITTHTTPNHSGGYFDSYGIIRDVVQNHLAQLLALVAMEPPVSGHPDDIRDEKCKVLRAIAPVHPSECVLGQYTAGPKGVAGGQPGYLDDETVPEGSNCPTFAACRLDIRNERWSGVPFVLRAGKALNERSVTVRMQLRDAAAPAGFFGGGGGGGHHGGGGGGAGGFGGEGGAGGGGAAASATTPPTNMTTMRNEFVMRLQPGEAVYAKMVVKKPGLDMAAELSELDLSYSERYSGVAIPDAYERLILDCIRGDQQHFVRRDELRAAWAIFTPLLHSIDRGEVKPLPYAYGSRGPSAADELLARAGYVRTRGYLWKPPSLEKGVGEAGGGEGASGDGSGAGA
jgi:glucose-6-phosphate 1-dehydrogenase